MNPDVVVSGFAGSFFIVMTLFIFSPIILSVIEKVMRALFFTMPNYLNKKLDLYMENKKHD